MIYYVDIDGTICNNTYGDYELAQPIMSRIDRLNTLYDQGNEIHYWTSRGMRTGKDWGELTARQLQEWGCKYTSFNMRKPMYDIWIDDKAINDKDFFVCTL